MTSDTLIPDLRAQWLSLTDRFGVDRKVAKAEFKELKRTFEQPIRHYHTLEHVNALLKLIDQFEGELKNPDLLRFVAWYHDVIYDSTRTDNERVSAAYALESMETLSQAEEFLEAVAALILRTEGHKTEGTTPDEALFLDFDLSILGTPTEVYKNYALQVRAEYGWVSPDAYIAGRKQVLDGFLNRDRIYATDLCIGKWESQARSNLKWEIEMLESNPEAFFSSLSA